MAKRKITVTVDEHLVAAARLGSESLSAVVNSALVAEMDRRARAVALERMLAGWEAEHGAINHDAVDAARNAFEDLDGTSVSSENHEVA